MRTALSAFLAFALIIESVSALPMAFAQDAGTVLAPAADSAVSVPETPITDSASSADPATPPAPSEEIAPATGGEGGASNSSEAVPAAEGESGEKQEENTDAATEVPNQMFTDRQEYGRRAARPDVDESTGALVYKYPVAIPPGRNGLQPDIALSYNSQNTDLMGVVGYGWSLDMPSISRMAKHGVDALYVENIFSASMSGELVTSTAANEYVPRIEGGDFLRYARAGDAWTVADKQGTVYSFGASAASRQDDPADATHIYKWMLDRVEDANGNTIIYTYAKANGQIYPATITYTGHGAEAGAFTVTFVREAQPQEARTNSYRSGFLVENFERIKTIEVRVSGMLVRSYALTYAPGATGALSVISYITETGWDSAGQATALPPAHFVYTPTPQRWTTFISRMPEYSGYPGDFLNPSGIDLFDVNMDSFPDIVSTHAMQHGFGQPLVSQRAVYIFDPVSRRWNENGSYQAPQGALSYQSAPWGSGQWWNGTWGAYIDVNGDSRTDLIRGYTSSSPSLIAATSSWADAQSWQAPFPLGYEPPPINNNYGRVLVGDVNGDGLPDLGFHPPGSSGEVIMSNGVGGWRNLAGGGSLQTPGETGLAIALADVNGDGLADMIRGRAAYYDHNTGQNVPASYGTYLSTGRGFAQVSPDGLNMNQGPFDNGVRAIDMDGNGIAEPCQCFPSGNGGGGNRVWIGDLNGDGVLDRIFGTGSVYPQEISADLSNGPRPNLLLGIFTPEGGSYGFDYKGSAEYRDAQNQPLNTMPTSITTVRRVSYDSLGANSDTFYEYAGGAMWYDAARPEDRRFAGFGSIKKIEPDGTYTKTYFHQGNSPAGPGEREDSFARIGKPYRVESYDATGNIVRTVLTKWEETMAGGRDFVAATETLQFDYDGPSAHRDRAVSSVYDPATGNLTQKTEWGEVQGSDAGSFTDIGNDKYLTAYQYATNGTGRDAPSIITKTDQSSAKVAEVRNYYDNLPLGSLALGNLTKEERWKEGASYISMRKTYNAYGLVTEERDPRDKPTTYGYDALHLYPETVTDALSHATTYFYHYALGKVRETVDMNGRRFQTFYDGLGRIKEERQPDADAPATLVPKASYEYTDAQGQFRVRKTEYIGDGNLIDTYTYLDGIGRVAQERRISDQPGRFIVHDFLYNPRALVERDSLPYFSMNTPRTGITGDPNLWTRYAYDVLGRVTAVTNAVGTVSHTFAGWRETITDARGKVKRLNRDAYDRLASVEEINGSETYVTSYSWNGNGKLTAMTDALGNVRAFSYDGLGRRTIAQDLHAPADTTFGVWTFSYDDAGNQISAVDPIGNGVARVFDDVNRLLTEDSPVTKRTDVVNQYDACPDGIGRLCGSATPPVFASSSYAYDPLGRVRVETRFIENDRGASGVATYATSRTYHRQGSIAEVTHPDGTKVRYLYNLGGLVERIEKRAPGGGAYAPVVLNFDYNPLGQVSVEEAANGTITNNTYAQDELWRLRKRATIIPGGARFQDITYSYDPNGNVLRIVDASQTNAAKTMDYAYDDLNRMRAATTTLAANGQNGGSSWTYDAIGNLAYSSDAGVYRYDGNLGQSYANPHAVTSLIAPAVSTSFSYDQNGNVLTAGSRSFSWDYRNRLSWSLEASSTAVSSYRYDASNTRITELNGAGPAVHYPTSAYEQTGSNPPKVSVFTGDTLIATLENGTPFYAHTDHLSGSNVVTTAQGTLAELLDYDPYGTTRIDQQAASSTFRSHRTFTGHVRDENTGLQYMEARYYRSASGRFLSQDPAFLAIGDEQAVQGITQMAQEGYLASPQLMNAYAYVANNPLRYKDTTGAWLDTVIDLAFIANDVRGISNVYSTGQGSYKQEFAALGLDILGAALPFVTGLGVAARAVSVVDDISDIQKAVKEVEVAGEVLRGSRNPIVREAAAEGRAQHRLYRADESDGVTKFKEFRFENGRRADFLDKSTKTVYELKPDSPQAIQRGLKQLESYVRQANRQFQTSGYRGVIQTYKKVKR